MEITKMIQNKLKEKKAKLSELKQAISNLETDVATENLTEPELYKLYVSLDLDIYRIGELISQFSNQPQGEKKRRGRRKKVVAS
jgi:Na+/phosphate symporter